MSMIHSGDTAMSPLSRTEGRSPIYRNGLATALQACSQLTPTLAAHWFVIAALLPSSPGETILRRLQAPREDHKWRLPRSETCLAPKGRDPAQQAPRTATV